MVKDRDECLKCADGEKKKGHVAWRALFHIGRNLGFPLPVHKPHHLAQDDDGVAGIYPAVAFGLVVYQRRNVGTAQERGAGAIEPN